MMGLNELMKRRRPPKGNRFATDETETTGIVRDAAYPKNTHTFLCADARHIPGLAALLLPTQL